MPERDTQHTGYLYTTGGESHRLTHHVGYLYVGADPFIKETQHVGMVYASVDEHPPALSNGMAIPAFIGM